MRDVLLEIWQANAAGRYNHPLDRQDKPLDEGFRGWGRTGTDFKTGLYTFETIKPGAVVGRAGKGSMAPHVNFWIVGARHQYRAEHEDVFLRRGGSERPGPGAETDRAREARVAR